MAKRPGSRSAPGSAEKMAADKADNLKTLIQYFEDAEEASTDARKLSERDRDYYDNKQLTAAELAALKKRGQPDVIINRIQTKVNYLLGYEASQRTDPRGFPRTPQDEDASGAVTDALNYVRDATDLAQTFSAAWENMLVEGSAGIEVGVTPRPDGNADITITSWDWDRLFADPHSRKHDYSDARYLGGVIWMDEDQARDRWPDAEDVIGKTVTEEQSQTYSDRPAWKTWASPGTRKRIRVVQMYHKEGDKWLWCIFTKGGKLASGEVPFVDQDGVSRCPLLMQSAFVNRKNERYGFVRALIGPQDEINKRRSKSLHLLMGRPFRYEEGAIDDVDDTKAELARANGAVKVNPGFADGFALLDNSQELQGHIGLLQEAKNEIDLLGPNAAMQGKGDRSASGRAIMANQQGGQIEIYRLVDRHANLKRRTYMMIWTLIRQYWTAEKMIRVTDDEKNVRFVGLNKPITLQEDMLAQAKAAGIPDDVAMQEIQQRAASDPMVAQQLQQVVRVENIPAEMEMDIKLEEVPDSANMQQEQFEILAKLAPAVTFPPEVYIEMSALRNKKQLLERLEKLKAPQPNPGKEQAEKLELDKMAATVEKLHAEIEKIRADALQSRAKADSLDGQFGQVIMPRIIDASQPLPPNGPPGQTMPGGSPMGPPMGSMPGDGGQGLPFDPAMMGPPPMDPGFDPGMDPAMMPPQGPPLIPDQGLDVMGGYPPPIDPAYVPGIVPQLPDQGGYQGF